MVAAGGFLEHATVFDNCYGTARQQVEESLAAGQDLILEIDWQGAGQIRRALPECLLRSSSCRPSRDELERRLRGRGTDAEDVIRRRLRDAAADMAHWREFDYVVVNDDFERALDGAAGNRRRPGSAAGAARASRAGGTRRPAHARLTRPGQFSSRQLTRRAPTPGPGRGPGHLSA